MLKFEKNLEKFLIKQQVGIDIFYHSLRSYPADNPRFQIPTQSPYINIEWHGGAG